MSKQITGLPRIIGRGRRNPMIRVSHNVMEGTRVSGSRDTAIDAILDAHGLRWSHRLGQWCLPGSTGSDSIDQCRSLALELRETGVDVELADAASPTPPALAAAPIPVGVITLRHAHHQTFIVQRHLFELLRVRLLALGGARLVIPEAPDPELPALTGEAALVFDGQDAVWRPGAPRECHRNTVALWQRREAEILTGYALSPDRAWVQHTWGLTKAGSLIETTMPFEKYLGVCLSGDSALEFAEVNS